MKYVGSKRRIINTIGKIIIDGCTGDLYEPFCGGLNATEWFVGKNVNVIASDNNAHLISLYNEVAAGREFPFINKTLYYDIKQNPQQYPAWLVGYAGACCGFRCVWFGAYADYHAPVGERVMRTPQFAARESLLQHASLIRKVKPFEADYRDIIPTRKTVYLDPPYAGTDKKLYRDSFDRTAFLNYIEMLKRKDNKVFISEYAMPPEFKVVWECKLQAFDSNKVATEKLFTI